MYRLDFDAKTVVQISNDAFHMLMYDEEPIDPDNAEEAEEIKAMFPNSFIIDDNWDYLDDEPGMVECTIIPYKPDDFKYDLYSNQINGWQLQVKIVEPKSTVQYRFYKEYTHNCKMLEVKQAKLTSVDGKLWLFTEKGSRFPIFSMKKA